MVRDEIVDEVRAIRDAYARSLNYDLDAICRDLKEKRRAKGLKTVNLPPRRTATAVGP